MVDAVDLPTSMTLRQLYAGCVSALGTLEGREIFRFVTGHSSQELPFVGELPAPPKAIEQAESLLCRREKGEPLQYLIGEWDFYGLTLSVGPGVLIPRSDTEPVVEKALELLRSKTLKSPSESPSENSSSSSFEESFASAKNNPTQPLEILDLGTGSGAIALALALHCPEAAVTALEISPQAFSYFQRNNTRHGNLVCGVLQDFLEYTHPVPVDFLVSNPPYIPAGEVEGLQREVSFEPTLALDGGPDGLDFYRKILQHYTPQLAAGGQLLFEVGIHQAQPVQQLLCTQGFVDIGSVDDLSGIPRGVYGTKP